MPGPISPKSVLGTGQANSLLLYTAPANGAVLSLVQLTNDSTGALSGRVRFVPAAATSESAVHTIVPMTPVAAGDAIEKTGGMTLGNGDKVMVAGDAGLIFTLCGTEM